MNILGVPLIAVGIALFFWGVSGCRGDGWCIECLPCPVFLMQVGGIVLSGFGLYLLIF